MKKNRFDVIEFKVLSCGKGKSNPHSLGYYPEGEERERALLLQAEGIFVEKPESEWRISGWTFTDKGNKYFTKFLSRVRAKHGHVWETNHDSNPDYIENDEYGKEINFFAYSSGYHNGMKCKNCGFEFCHHCTSEFEVEKCTK